jgi:hypothetical protein
MTAIVTNFLHSLFATNEDSFVIFMFIVVGMVLSICLTLGSVPRHRWDEQLCPARPSRAAKTERFQSAFQRRLG